MKDLEPAIHRQRLIIEGHYSEPIESVELKEYLKELSKVLKMKIVSGPFCEKPKAKNSEDWENHGLNGFITWSTSGTQVYTWDTKLFFTVDIYSCKPYQISTAVNFTKRFFKSKDLVFKEV